MNAPKIISRLRYLIEGPDERVVYLTKKYTGKPFWRFCTGFSNVPDASPLAPGFEGFVRKIVYEVDPTHGKYSDWIMRVLNGMCRADLMGVIAKWDEDMPKVHHNLTLYHQYRHKLGGSSFSGKDIKTGPHELVPISKLTNIDTVNNFVTLYRLAAEIEEVMLQNEEHVIGPDEVEKVYESPAWIVLIPKTERASCKYGAGTQWCTAAKTNNYFDHYNKQGPLYIVINRSSQEKWQFHFEAGQFMDNTDTPIKIDAFFKSHPELGEVFFKISAATCNKKLSQKNKVLRAGEAKSAAVEMMFSIDPERAVGVMSSFDDEVCAAMLSNNFGTICRWGLLEPDKINTWQKWLRFDDHVVVWRTFKPLSALVHTFGIGGNSNFYVKVLSRGIQLRHFFAAEFNIDILDWGNSQFAIIKEVISGAYLTPPDGVEEAENMGALYNALVANERNEGVGHQNFVLADLESALKTAYKHVIRQQLYSDVETAVLSVLKKAFQATDATVSTDKENVTFHIERSRFLKLIPHISADAYDISYGEDNDANEQAIISLNASSIVANLKPALNDEIDVNLAPPRTSDNQKIFDDNILDEMYGLRARINYIGTRRGNEE